MQAPVSQLVRYKYPGPSATSVRTSHTNSYTTGPTIEALFSPDAGPGAEDAELRDRSAPDVCLIAILRGLLL